MQPLSTSARSGTTQPCARPLQARPGAAWLLGLAVAATLAAPAQLQARDFASTQAQPRTEHWQRRQADIDTQLRDTAALPAYRLVFVGDSITDFWLFDNNPWGKGRYGRRIWDESFGGRDPANRALNLGISGDRLEHVLHRLKPRAEGGLGVLDAPGLKPEFLVVLIGINNTWAGEEPLADSVFAGVQAVLTSLRQRQPQARLIVQSLLPTNEPEKNRDVVLPVNQRLVALLASPPWAGQARYLDLYASFVDGQGRQIASLFTDGLHPNEDGYRVWRDRLLPTLQQARKER